MKNNILKILLIITIIVILFMLVVVGGTFAAIYLSVSKTCNQAKAAYNTDCVTAMVLTLKSTNTSFSEKNHAIWILGQLADKKALPVLKEFYSSVPEHTEPLGKALSQYELSKAIKWCEEGNATSWMYKYIK